MAIGSPLSPILSNIYMEEFQRKAIDEYKLKPSLWLRYVDDTFVIWPHEKTTLNKFLEHINSIEESIKFTMKLEKNRKISFLDVLVQSKDNSIPVTKVYKKSIKVRQHLHFNSNHQYATKIEVAKCLYTKAATICSIEEVVKTEIEDKPKTLKLNGYPDRTSKIAIEKETERNERPTTTMVIPYVKGLSEKIRKPGNTYTIKTAFKSTNTTRSILTKIKLDNEIQKSKNCV